MLPSDESDAAIPDIVDRYQGPLLAYAQRMIGDAHAAQDAVQETFLRLCRHRDVPPSRLAAWLFSVCRTRVIDMQRKHRPEQLDTIASVAVAPEPPVADSLEQDEDRDELARRIAELTPRQQEVLQLRMQAGLSYQQIAEVTGLKPGNVGFHLHAAVAALRHQLAPKTA
ncbi:MAG: sigma-70 family RNA polymerase sigma factor [Planctomycetota bacterium]